jgi:hypothetical protein
VDAQPPVEVALSALLCMTDDAAAWRVPYILQFVLKIIGA